MTGNDLDVLLHIVCWKRKITMQDIADKLEISRRSLFNITSAVEVEESFIKKLISIGIEPSDNPFIENKNLKEQLTSCKKDLKHYRIVNELLISKINILKRVIDTFIGRKQKLVTPSVRKILDEVEA